MAVGQGNGPEWWKKLVDMQVKDIDNQGGLHTNEAINKFTGIPEMAFRMTGKNNQSLGEAFAKTFYNKAEEIAYDEAGEIVEKGSKNVVRTGWKGSGFRWGKAAGSAWAAYTAASTIGGAIKGALTDKNGQLDIPGIPFI